MRKEVRRSLVAWPAVAAATIVVGTSLPTSPKSLRVSLRSLVSQVTLLADRQSRGRQWPQPPGWTDHQQQQWIDPRLALHFEVDTTIRAPETEPILVERTEHGIRAMSVPARLAGVMQQPPLSATLRSAKVLPAPILNEQRETAGLVLQPSKAPPTDGSPTANSLPAATPQPALPSQPESIEQDRSLPLVGPVRPSRTTQPPAKLQRTSVLPDSIANLGKLDSLSRTQRLPADQLTSPKPVPELAVNSAGDAELDPTGDSVPETPLPGLMNPTPAWPATVDLDEQLQLLITTLPSTSDRFVSVSNVDVAPLSDWVQHVQDRLLQLQSLPQIGHPRAGELIADLSQLAESGIDQAEANHDRQRQIHWLCAAHAIERRTRVWMPIWQIANADRGQWNAQYDVPRATLSLDQAIQQLQADLIETGDADGWCRYLLLSELAELARCERLDERRVLAQRFLSRLQWHRLDQEQTRWLDRPAVRRLADLVRPWSSAAVDYAELLAQVERQEADAVDLAAIDITGAIQSLRFAVNPQAVSVASALDTHYRNANVRMAVSDTMLQRLLPNIEPQTVPVKTWLLGSRVRGVSQIQGELSVKLNPAPDRWSLELQTTGDVASKSTGFNGPVAVRTLGDSHFVAATPIEITRLSGARQDRTVVNAHGATRLRGIRSDYDRWPLIGTLLRGYAETQYDAMAPQSNRIANRKMSQQLAEKIDTRVDRKLEESGDRFAEMILGPLGKLQLDPQVIDLQTTNRRLIARYRIAGDWQLGAFTPRPRAPQTSLMSVQVHQSALNNTLEQVVLRDQPQLIQDIVGRGLDVFGYAEATIPDDVPRDVTIQFASTRPITVEVEDGGLWVTLRVMRLSGGGRLDLRRFIVRALYRPEFDGLQARLVRDGHLRISGPGMSMRQRLPIRTLFNKVLSPNRPWQLTLPQLIESPATENLAVSQLELRDGWIALAISDAAAPRIALQPREPEGNQSIE